MKTLQTVTCFCVLLAVASWCVSCSSSRDRVRNSTPPASVKLWLTTWQYDFRTVLLPWREVSEMRQRKVCRIHFVFGDSADKEVPVGDGLSVEDLLAKASLRTTSAQIRLIKSNAVLQSRITDGAVEGSLARALVEPGDVLVFPVYREFGVGHETPDSNY